MQTCVITSLNNQFGGGKLNSARALTLDAEVVLHCYALCMDVFSHLNFGKLLLKNHCIKSRQIVFNLISAHAPKSMHFDYTCHLISRQFSGSILIMIHIHCVDVEAS